MFLYDGLDRDYSRGPPSPPGHGLLTWSGHLGARRTYTFEDLLTVTRGGNFVALSAGHYHFLPTRPTEYLVQQLEEALSSLGAGIRAFFTSCQPLTASVPLIEVIDLESSDTPQRGAFTAPSYSHRYSTPLLNANRSAASRLSSTRSHIQAPKPDPVGELDDSRRETLELTQTNSSCLAPPDISADGMRDSASKGHKRSRQASLLHLWPCADPEASPTSKSLKRAPSGEKDLPAARARNRPASEKQARKRNTPLRSVKLPRPRSLRQFWQSAAESQEENHPPTLMQSPADEPGCVSPPPPKRGRVGPTGVVMLGIG